MIPTYTIRECTEVADYYACVEMQRTVWQFADEDLTPMRSFMVTRHAGGFTYGAFAADGRMVGFAHALPAIDDELRPYFYSQMLAVEPTLQNTGIGVRLKLAQRENALRRGVKLITWTFDPLQSRNAYLNIVKLGCVVRKYEVNFYGNDSTSVLHRGLDTDRLFAEWWVGSEHVAAALAGRRRNDEPLAGVAIPREIEAVKARELAAAQRIQIEVRAAFRQCLAEGLYCAGFEAGRDGGHSRYLFFKDEHQEER